MHRPRSQLQPHHEPAAASPSRSEDRRIEKRKRGLAPIPEVRIGTSGSNLHAARRIDDKIRKRQRKICPRFEGQRRRARSGISRLLDRGGVGRVSEKGDEGSKSTSTLKSVVCSSLE